MQLTLAHVGGRPGSRDGIDAQTQVYLDRCSPFAHCKIQAFRTEDALMEWRGKQQGPGCLRLRSCWTAAAAGWTSEGFCGLAGSAADEGAQHIVFAIGPANGWSETARERADLLLSLGPMTLAHALARLVIAEQIYRAYTILTGHPYHGGH